VGDATWADEPDGSMSGYAEIQVPIRRVAKGDALNIDVTYTVCDEKTCKPAKTVRLTR
jgi:hypothetical protein